MGTPVSGHSPLPLPSCTLPHTLSSTRAAPPPTADTNDAQLPTVSPMLVWVAISTGSLLPGSTLLCACVPCTFCLLCIVCSGMSCHVRLHGHIFALICIAARVGEMRLALIDSCETFALVRRDDCVGFVCVSSVWLLTVYAMVSAASNEAMHPAPCVVFQSCTVLTDTPRSQ
jgi:hypothetical protein